MFDFKIKKTTTPSVEQSVRSILWPTNSIILHQTQIKFIFLHSTMRFLVVSFPSRPSTSTVRGSPGRYRDLKNNDLKFTWVEWPERDLSASEIGIRMSSKWALNEISTSFLRLYELSPSYVKSLYDFS